MSLTLRHCAGRADFSAISAFLCSLYRPDNRDGNWFQPIWEYAYTHPWFDDDSVERIGLWEDDGHIHAACMYESRLGEAFFNIAPGFEQLKPAMLDYAEAWLAGRDDAGNAYLRAYVNDFDAPFEREVARRGYAREPDFDRPISQIDLIVAPPVDPLPTGFRLQSLADDNDLAKVDRVLWRGFNHAGEPPRDGIDGRIRMQSGPNFRRDLTIVVVAPGGEFAAFAGLWFDPINAIGYVEPVATDPAFRRLGLGTAAVREGLRRCHALGASAAYVGSDQPFYLNMGFRVMHVLHCWRRS